jgi:hypothetical protein
MVLLLISGVLAAFLLSYMLASLSCQVEQRYASKLPAIQSNYFSSKVLFIHKAKLTNFAIFLG